MKFGQGQLALKGGRRGVVIAAFAAITTCAYGQTQSPTPLTSVDQIRNLTTEQAGEGRPVVLHGVVTVLSGWKSSFFFQDQTHGISIDRLSQAPRLSPADEVEIHGVTGAGKFAPIVLEQSVTVLGRGGLPEAPLVGPNDLLGGKLDSQWVAVRGLVREAMVATAWNRPTLFLTVGIGGGTLVSVRVHDFAEGDEKKFIGAVVRIRGVCGTIFNDKRQFIGSRLFAANTQDIAIEHAAVGGPFDAPEKALNGLMQFGAHEEFVNRVKLRGVVTYARPGKELFIQKGIDGLRVESAVTSNTPVGGEVEVVGYPAAGEYSPKLVNAVYRSVPTTSVVRPIQTSAADVIVVKDGFSSAAFDSALISVRGKLIDEVVSHNSLSLILQDGATVFMAKLPQGANDQVSLPIGSELRLTGICTVDADEKLEARSFILLLRSSADVVLTKSAPWWTASHALYVVVVLLLTIVGLIAWAILVRRQSDLREQAVTDPLTGIYNRRGFLLLAQQQWQLAQRRNDPMLLFYIDVDEFKEINDTFGHKQGDVALKSVAQLLQDTFRKADIVGRLGGDEFAITAIDATRHSKELLQQRIADALHQANEKQRNSFSLALSIGVLECDSSMLALPIEDLLEKADRLMYESKRHRKSSGSKLVAA